MIRKRCPNGFVKDKKTGECIKKGGKVPTPVLVPVPVNNKPQKMKVKSQLQPIIDRLIKQKNLNKINKMLTQNINENAHGFIGNKASAYVKDNHNFWILYKWLSNKYKHIMNEKVYRVDVYMKNKQVNMYTMKTCFIENGYMRKMGMCLLSGLIHYAERAEKERQNNKKYYILPIIIYKPTGAHMNVLVHDLKTNIIHRFEPHGRRSKFTTVSLDNFLKRHINFSYAREGIAKRQQPKYIGIKNLPYNGPQVLDKWGKGPGRCAIWTLAYMNYRLQYTHLKESQIFEYMGRTEKDATRFIKKYMTYLRKNQEMFHLFDTKQFRKNVESYAVYTL